VHDWTITARDEHRRAPLNAPESLRGGQTLNRLQAESPSAAYGPSWRDLALSAVCHDRKVTEHPPLQGRMSSRRHGNDMRSDMGAA
jgi:hypothetical protein